jgi:hypothetical protein
LNSTRPSMDSQRPAHQAAVKDALRFIEQHALFTRTGPQGIRQVNVQGLVATAFTHRDSRASDPELHTHVAVANKVQTLDAFDDGRHHRISDRPQGGDRLHRGERQVVTSHRLGSRPGVFRDLTSELPGVNRLAAVLGEEELAGHLGPHPRPLCGREGSAGGKAGCRIDCREASGHLEAERADANVNDLEGRAEPDRLLVVASGDAESCQLLLPKLGQRVQAEPEQRAHLLGGHRIVRGQAADPVQAGTDPHPRRLASFGVVRRQPEATLLGRVQGRHLPGQIVIPRPRSELVDAHRHTHPKGVHAAGRSGRAGRTSGRALGVSSSEWGQ